MLLGGVFFFVWYRAKLFRNASGERIKNSVFLEVLVPKESAKKKQDEAKDDEELIGVAEQLFATLGQKSSSFIKSKESLSFEIISTDKKISFFVNCPVDLRDLIEKQIQAQYPDAQIDEVEAPVLNNPDSHISAVELGLQKKYYYPIKTYEHMESDPLNSLTNSLSKLRSDESGAIQLTIAPAGSAWRGRVTRQARQIQSGKDVDSGNNMALKGVNLFAKGLSDMFTYILNPSSQKSAEEKKFDRDEEEKHGLTPMQQEAVKRLEEKASKEGYEANLRIFVSSTSQQTAEAHLRNILSSVMQYSQPPFNGFRVLKKSSSKVLFDFIIRAFVPSLFSKMILNTEELASIFHLPTADLETPNIKWLSSKGSPAPVNLPEDGLLLGVNVYRGVETEIRMKEKDRRRHMYIIGRTGTGKSEFIKNLAKQDIEDGKGLAVVDPHGDLATDLLQFIPKERADDVILFEPFDTERPMGLNMLEARTKEEEDFAVQEMISIFYKLFPPEMIGPMFEHNMRNAMLTLMADKNNPGTIAEIPRIFTDTDYQKYKLTFVKDPVVRSFWEKEMAKTSDFHKSEMLGYLVSKVGRFVENEMMRNIIGQSHSAFDLRKVMDDSKILLVNLSKGRTGEVNSKLLGLILVSKLQMAALSRANMPEEQRNDFYLYIDEFQNFVTDSLATILSEARKYRLNLVMAHQYISQLVEGQDTKIRDAVFGNAGTMISFRIGVEDAEVAAKEYDPVFNEYDLVNIEKYHAYVKLMVDGTASRPFNMKTLPPASGGSEKIAEAIRNYSRLKYGRSKQEVEREINKRARLEDQPSSVPGVEPSS